MRSMNKELVCLVMQFLHECNYTESLHSLEQESGFFFNMKYFEEKVQAGQWDEVEKYLSGFTDIDTNRISVKIFFEIRKQKYLEALDRNDRHSAVDILVNDLKVFSVWDDELYKELTELLTLENFRENAKLTKYGDITSVRDIVLSEVKNLIEADPLIRKKLAFPSLEPSRLKILINQSLNWQHSCCKNPQSNPDIKTLLIDHTCNPPNRDEDSAVSTPLEAFSKCYVHPHHVSHAPHPAPFAGQDLASWMAEASASPSFPSAAMAASPIPVPPNQAIIANQNGESEQRMKRLWTSGDYQNGKSEQRVKQRRSEIDEGTGPSPVDSSWSLEDIPNKVVCTMAQASKVTSMDFHPSCQTLLLVGCSNGEIAIWEIGLQKKLVLVPFQIQVMHGCSTQVQGFAANDSISINRVTWSPDGDFIGVAFTKHLIHLLAYQRPDHVRQIKEVDAHSGAVNDISFSCPYDELFVITCGDDKLVKVWSMDGESLFVFDGHDAPVYSICPHYKESFQFIFSTSIDGEIKAWLYDNVPSTVHYNAPGRSCSRLLYSADRTRLFICGTNKEGEPYLAEWNESEGSIKRTYSGFHKKSAGVVQFDTAQNHFLAAGEDKKIKFWDVDNTEMLTSTDAGGGLPDLPCLRFNKEGNLLAVAADNGFKILANDDGVHFLSVLRNRQLEVLRSPSDTSSMKISGTPIVAGISPNNSQMNHLGGKSPAMPFTTILNAVNTVSRNIDNKRISKEMPDKGKPWEPTEILNPQQFHALSVLGTPDSTTKVVRLLYTNSGSGLLVLASNGIQTLWKWNKSKQNQSGMATAGIMPYQCKPNSGHVMINEKRHSNNGEAVPCIALSNNDSYVVSAYGGKISLFNMITFKPLARLMPAPPASTFIAFHPQDNNTLAVGMEDSTIHIYNVRVDEVKAILKSHHKRISGLAFSSRHNVLVSSGADAQICVWASDTWEEKNSFPIEMPAGKAPAGDTRVQFNSDQSHLLVVHESHLAIYDALKMERLYQWIPRNDSSASISSASYSCNSQLIFTSFNDGMLGIFSGEKLQLRCRIAPPAYMSLTAINSNPPVYPLVVAAHPLVPNQFAIGLSDGSVRVIEPLESDGTWGAPR